MSLRTRNGELVKGVFEVLMDAPEGMQASEVLKAVEKRVPPNAHEQEDYASTPGVRRYEKIVRFATIGPVKAGWLVKDKGTWTLTDEGRAAYKAFPNPDDLRKEWDRLYGEWKKGQPKSDGDEEEGDGDKEQLEDRILDLTVAYIADHRADFEQANVRAVVFERVGEDEVKELIRNRIPAGKAEQAAIAHDPLPFVASVISDVLELLDAREA